MKAFTLQFGEVQVIEKTKTTITVQLEDGTIKSLIPTFVKLTDADGNEITDFSSIKESVIIPSNIGRKNTTGRKTSKLAEMQGAWMERNDYVGFNHLTKKFY